MSQAFHWRPALPLDNGSTNASDVYYPTSHLRLKFISLRELPLHFSVHILLELFHVEQFKRFIHLQEAVGQLEDVVAHGRLLGGVLHVDVGLGHSLDQNVAAIVHLELAAGADL